jgi:hypothetical protein
MQQIRHDLKQERVRNDKNTDFQSHLRISCGPYSGLQVRMRSGAEHFSTRPPDSYL